jgi:hypothetical protein
MKSANANHRRDHGKVARVRQNDQHDRNEMRDNLRIGTIPE